MVVLPWQGSKNHTMMVMLLPEDDGKGNTTLHVGIKSEGHSPNAGIIDQIEHLIDWFKKKILRHETPSIYPTVRKEDKFSKEIKKLYEEIKGDFKEYVNKKYAKVGPDTDNLQLKTGDLGSDPSLSSLDKYLQRGIPRLKAGIAKKSGQAQSKNLAKLQNLLTKVNDLRNHILVAEMRALAPQQSLENRSLNSDELTQKFAELERSPSEELFNQVKKELVTLGYAEPTSLATNTEVMMPTLKKMVDLLSSST